MRPMHMLRIVASAGICLVFALSTAHSFDNDRKGFVLGFGAGVGVLTSPGIDVASPVGFQTDLTIGGGLSKQFQLHYTGKQFWYFENGTFFTLANPLIGVTYYLKPAGPSAFISASAGASIGLAFWEGGGGLLGGPAYHFGTGYEFDRDMIVKFDVLTAYMSASDWRLWNISLTVNVLGY